MKKEEQRIDGLTYEEYVKKHEEESRIRRERMEDSASLTQEFLMDAEKSIDHQFGSGYAKKNPYLVASFMRIQAKSYSEQPRILRELKEVPI